MLMLMIFVTAAGAMLVIMLVRFMAAAAVTL